MHMNNAALVAAAFAVGGAYASYEQQAPPPVLPPPGHGSGSAPPPLPEGPPPAGGKYNDVYNDQAGGIQVHNGPPPGYPVVPVHPPAPIVPMPYPHAPVEAPHPGETPCSTSAAAVEEHSSVYQSIGYTVEVLTTYTTICPSATQLTYNGKTYTVTEATTLTITDCPCTITRPAHHSTVTECEET